MGKALRTSSALSFHPMSSKEVPLTVLVVVVQVDEVVVPSSDRIGVDGLVSEETVDDEISVRVVCGADDKVVGGVFAVFGHASVAKVLLLRGSSSL